MPTAAFKEKSENSVAAKRQMGALPFRTREDGRLEILIITSRDTGRFIIPKGWPMKGLKDYKAAAKEAFQEAGVSGKPGSKPFGSYSYFKRFAETFELVSVDVYPLEVHGIESSWPEKGQRKMAWLSLEDAAILIDEPELVSLIQRFAVERLPKS